MSRRKIKIGPLAWKMEQDTQHGLVFNWVSDFISDGGKLGSEDLSGMVPCLDKFRHKSAPITSDNPKGPISSFTPSPQFLISYYYGIRNRRCPGVELIKSRCYCFAQNFTKSSIYKSVYNDMVEFSELYGYVGCLRPNFQFRHKKGKYFVKN